MIGGVLRLRDGRLAAGDRGDAGRPAALAADRHQPDGALHRDRHPGRDGDAAQPVPAFEHRPDARLSSATTPARAMAIKFATIDSTVALLLAFFINAAILIAGGGGVLRHPVCRVWPTSATPTSCCRRCWASPVASTTVRRGAAGLRPELDADRHAGRADRDGRLPEHSHAALAAPPDHPR